MQLIVSALKGYAVEAADGRIGSVSDFLFDDRTWKVRWLVVDTGVWLPGRKVLIHPSAIAEIDKALGELHVVLTKKKIQESPDIRQDEPVSLQMEYHLYEHYGWDPIWDNPGYFGGGALGAPLSPLCYEGEHKREREEMEARSHEGDPDLRSIATVTGYHVHATDGLIGHVENFMVEKADWSIRYLIVDTKNWWPGEHVLLAPYAIKEISWSKKQILTNVDRDHVKSSPPWHPLEPAFDAYEKRLHGYYGWGSYGW